MALNLLTAHDTISFAGLKELAAAKSPCITIVTVISNPAELAVRLKNAVRSVQKQLAVQEVDAALRDSLLQPIEEVTESIESAGIWANALILFRAPGIFEYYFLTGQFKERATVADRFYLEAMLSAMTREHRFHILALSQHSVRLLYCTPHTEEEVSLEGIAPTDMRLFMNTQQPDHLLDNRSWAGPSLGNMRGVLFSTSSVRDSQNEDLSHFFNAVDKGVSSLLRKDSEPLILAGVDYAVANYRRVNSYARLMEPAVTGSSDGLPDREIYKRAREIVMGLPSAELSKALASPERMDSSRLSTDPVEIYNAAVEGRVSDLFLCDTLSDDGIAELMNTAAIETLRYSGRAFSLRAAEMPVAADAAAVFRF